MTWEDTAILSVKKFKKNHLFGNNNSISETDKPLNCFCYYFWKPTLWTLLDKQDQELIVLCKCYKIFILFFTYFILLEIYRYTNLPMLSKMAALCTFICESLYVFQLYCTLPFHSRSFYFATLQSSLSNLSLA